MGETDNTLWIEEFLDGNLSGSDLRRFEERLSSDPEFEKEVKAQQMVRESFERAELKEFFNQINEKVERLEPTNEKRFFSMRFLAVAASVIFVLGISVFFLYKEISRDLSQPDFVAQSFDLKVSIDSMRGINEEINVDIIKSDQFENHYSFNNNSLKLYLKNSNISSSEIKMSYNPNAENYPYLIEIQGKEYIIEENSGPEPKALIEIP